MKRISSISCVGIVVLVLNVLLLLGYIWQQHHYITAINENTQETRLLRQAYERLEVKLEVVKDLLQVRQ